MHLPLAAFTLLTGPKSHRPSKKKSRSEWLIVQHLLTFLDLFLEICSFLPLTVCLRSLQTARPSFLFFFFLVYGVAKNSGDWRIFLFIYVDTLRKRKIWAGVYKETDHKSYLCS